MIRRSTLLALLLALGSFWAQAQSQRPLNGHVTRNGVGAANTVVFINRLIDSLVTGVPSSATTDSGGNYRVLVPFIPNTANLYQVSAVNCNGQMVFGYDSLGANGGTVNLNLCSTNPICPAEPAFTFTVQSRTVAFTVPSPATNQFDSWDFGDGRSDSSNGAISHTFAANGRYLVCHTAYAGGCSRRQCLFVEVGPQLRDLAGQVKAGGQCLNNVRDSIIVEIFGINGSYWVTNTSRDTACFYIQQRLNQGLYIVRATPNSQRLLSQGYLPTYFGNTVIWGSNNVVDLANSNYNVDIDLQRADSNLGNGINQVNVSLAGSGTLVNSSYIGAAPRAFVPSQARVLLYSSGGKKLGYARPTTNGLASFSYLPAGRYRLVPEVPLAPQTEEWVTVGNGSPATANATFAATANGLIPGVTALRGKVAQQALRAYPNPASSTLSISLPGFTGQGTVSLLAADGRTAHTQTISDLGLTTEVSVRSLAPGLYTAVITQNGRNVAAVRVQVVK